jgi:glucosamine--fructose-6-phosphate aminotransferase (isomerizing)
MCGIVGILGNQDVSQRLFDGLKRLEYRGYDSAGVATLNGQIDRRRAEGKLVNLEAKAAKSPLPGSIGIGHTRWATHGKPTEPMRIRIAADGVAVVHNGIIENFRAAARRAEADGPSSSARPTPKSSRIWSIYLQKGSSPVEAVQQALPRLQGRVRAGLLFKARRPDDRRPQRLAAGVGYGDGEMYLGSDAIALAPFTDDISYLEDGDWVVLTRKGCEIYDEAPARSSRGDRAEVRASTFMVDKGNYRHFMAQGNPRAAGSRRPHAGALCRSGERARCAARAAVRLQAIQRISITACGTAYLCRFDRQILVRALCARCRSKSMSLRVPLSRSAAAARAWRSSSRSRARPPTRWRRCAMPRAGHAPRSAVVNVPTSTIAREARPCCRRWRVRRSASPRPRPSPAS